MKEKLVEISELSGVFILIGVILYPIRFAHCYYTYGYITRYYLDGLTCAAKVLVMAILLIALVAVGFRWGIYKIESRKWDVNRLMLVSLMAFLLVNVWKWAISWNAGASTDVIWIVVKALGESTQLQYPRYMGMFLGLNLYYPVMVTLGARVIAEQYPEKRYVRYLCWTLLQFYIAFSIMRYYPQWDLVRSAFAIVYAITVHVICYYAYLLDKERGAKKKVLGIAGLSVAAGLIGWIAMQGEHLEELFRRMDGANIRHEIYMEQYSNIRELICSARLIGEMPYDKVTHMWGKNTLWFLLQETGWIPTLLYLFVILVVAGWVVMTGIRACKNKMEIAGVSACLMLSVRWLYGILMSFGLCPLQNSYSVIPFYGNQAFYDVLLLGVIVALRFGKTDSPEEEGGKIIQFIKRNMEEM